MTDTFDSELPDTLAAECERANQFRNWQRVVVDDHQRILRLEHIIEDMRRVMGDR